jgi:hypothetical protein
MGAEGKADGSKYVSGLGYWGSDDLRTTYLEPDTVATRWILIAIPARLEPNKPFFAVMCT